MPIDRRTLIRSAGQLAIIGGLSPAPLLARPLGANPFMLGVASGDPWPDGFVIWTRLAPSPLDEHGGMPPLSVPVSWEVAEDDRFGAVIRKGVAIARPELGHSVHIEVDGLRPGRYYWYRFHVHGSDTSRTGMARTAPAADTLAERLRIAVAGCQHWEHGYFDGWGHLARENDLDLVFHYGDYIYEGAAKPLGERAVRQHAGYEIYSLDDYRRRYAQYKSDAHLQAAHAACAFAVSFDDHEVDNNWAGNLDQDGTREDLFLLRRAAAFQAWYEHMPVRRTQFPRGGSIQAFRRLDFGRLLRMHVLDTRQYRSDQPCNDGKIRPCPKEAHLSPTMLGAVQENWLDEGLDNGAAWNLLAQQVLVMPYARHSPGEPESWTSYDTWDGYRPARERLIDTFTRHDLKNVVIVSGDFHRNFAGVVPEREDVPEGKAVAVEFLATSMTSNGDSKPIPEIERDRAANPHMQLINDARGYHVHDIEPTSWNTSVREISRVSAPGGTLQTSARFSVAPDAPILRREA
ncbi:MAG: alkaline phosphatase [Sphingomonadales bacterium]|nr:MAG: alkaline phosphatase [Sphingomonadales bacterium]TNF05937.1 MAG: alkaline phosphatase [Sphingomonadales bacterium]